MFIKDPKQGGYTTFFKDFPKLVAQGETVEEAQENLWNALYDTLKYFFDKKDIYKKEE